MGAAKPASTSSRNASVWSSAIAREAEAGELPARVRREEIAVRGPAVAARGRAACALEDQLAAHELGVVLAYCARRSSEAGERREAALGPFPDVAEDVAW